MTSIGTSLPLPVNDPSSQTAHLGHVCTVPMIVPHLPRRSGALPYILRGFDTGEHSTSTGEDSSRLMVEQLTTRATRLRLFRRTQSFVPPCPPQSKRTVDLSTARQR